ncbi:DUF1761 domain-containing protein [Candidatus Pacearchaeota archaeon]|nr:DUF1761 domain-containing protein [Candidatus Pacearchaeota archaeon]
MFDGIVNFGSTALIAVILFIIGFLWYGPLFGKLWVKLSKIPAIEVAKAKKKGMSGMWKSIVLNLIGNFILVYVLTGVIVLLGVTSPMQGAIVGFWIWLGFFACTTLLNSVILEGKPWGLFALNGLYWLVCLKLAGFLTVVWS